MIGYGMHLSASGALTSLYRMDVLGNNLSNLSTAGFKPELALAHQRDPARTEGDLNWMPSNRLMERLGGGVMNAPNRVSFQQGPLESTGNPLDLAIQGEGFFVLRDVEAEEGDRHVLTRDGRFTRDRDGVMVSASSGMPVMDVQNQRIRLAATGEIVIGPDGVIRQDGDMVARLSVVELDDLERVRKGTSGTFLAPADVMNRRRPASGHVKQHTIEGAAVDPIRAMLHVTNAGRAAEANFGMIQSHDQLMDRAINSLGRVQA